MGWDLVHQWALKETERFIYCNKREAKDIDPGTGALVRVRTDRSSLVFAFILTAK